MDWNKIKSGSDIRGIALWEDADLTNDVVRKLGAAFAQMLSKKTGKSIENL